MYTHGMHITLFTITCVGDLLIRGRREGSVATLQEWSDSWADMVLAASFKWRQFEPEVILLAIGWYLRFSLSYRDTEELLTERELRARPRAVSQ